MTRRAVVQKWILYSLCALALVLVQSLLLVRVQVWGVHPFLLPAIAVIPVTLERDEGALLFSVFFGLVCDLLTPVAGLPCFYALAFLVSGGLAWLLSGRVVAACCTWRCWRAVRPWTRRRQRCWRARRPRCPCP